MPVIRAFHQGLSSFHALMSSACWAIVICLEYLIPKCEWECQLLTGLIVDVTSFWFPAMKEHFISYEEMA